MDLLSLIGTTLLLVIMVTLIVCLLEYKIYGSTNKKLRVVVKGLLTSVAAVGIVAFISYTRNTGEMSAEATQFLPESFYNVSFAFLLLMLAIIPAYFVGRYIYNHDFDKEPKSLLIQLFLAGLGSIVVTLALTVLLMRIFPFFNVNAESIGGLLPLIPYVFIGVAFVEEFSKWIFTYAIGYKNKEFNHVYDIIVYAVFVSLGFAAFENILYVFAGLNDGTAIQIALMRSVTAVPGHAAFGVVMGYYLAMARISEKNNNYRLANINKVKSILFPTIVHGIYNYLLYATAYVGSISFMMFIVFVILLFQTATRKVKQLAALGYDLNMPILSTIVNRQNQYNYCPNCGESVIGAYCRKCGKKHN